MIVSVAETVVDAPEGFGKTRKPVDNFALCERMSDSAVSVNLLLTLKTQRFFRLGGSASFFAVLRGQGRAMQASGRFVVDTLKKCRRFPSRVIGTELHMWDGAGHRALQAAVLAGDRCSLGGHEQ